MFFFKATFFFWCVLPLTVDMSLRTLGSQQPPIIYVNCKPLTANVFARAILSQLLTMSGKRLFDVWILKASSGRAANWQDSQPPPKSCASICQRKHDASQTQTVRDMSVKEVSIFSEHFQPMVGLCCLKEDKTKLPHRKQASCSWRVLVVKVHSIVMAQREWACTHTQKKVIKEHTASNNIEFQKIRKRT